MTFFPFPAALLLLVGVVAIACSELAVGNSAPLFGYLDAPAANFVSPADQNERFNRAVPKFVQGGYFPPLAHPQPILDKCGAVFDWGSGLAPAGRAPLDGRTNRPAHQLGSAK